MKRVACILLACLLLTACGAKEETPETLQIRETEAPVVENPLVLVHQRANTMDFSGERDLYYDENGRCVREERYGAYEIFEYDYYEDGTLMWERHYQGDGFHWETDYNTQGQEKAMWTVTEDGSLQEKRTYVNQYDHADRLTEHSWYDLEEFFGEENFYTYGEDGSHTHEFYRYYGSEAGREDANHEIREYDPAGNLLRWYQDLEYGLEVSYETVYTYDNRGNVLVTENRSQYAPDVPVYLQRTTCTYDEYGNLLTREVYTEDPNSNHASTLYRYAYQNTYDAENRLTVQEESCSYEYRGKDGSVETDTVEEYYRWEYSYDIAGRMLLKEEHDLLYGFTNRYTWEYDVYGNLLKWTEFDMVVEENVYGRPENAQWEE